METIKIHSITDLITNSSTTIYTYSGASKQAAIDMINEFFKVFNINKKAEDCFIFTVTLEDDYRYYEKCPEDITEEQAKIIVEEVTNGKIEKPQWMSDIEDEEDWSYYTPPTTLNVIPKSEEYEALGRQLHKFLYSTSHEAFRDG